MKRPVAKISNHLRGLATFASDVSDHSRRLAKVANLHFALLRVQSKRILRLQSRGWQRFEVVGLIQSYQGSSGPPPFHRTKKRKIFVKNSGLVSDELLAKIKNKTKMVFASIQAFFWTNRWRRPQKKVIVRG